MLLLLAARDNSQSHDSLRQEHHSCPSPKIDSRVFAFITSSNVRRMCFFTDSGKPSMTSIRFAQRLGMPARELPAEAYFRGSQIGPWRDFQDGFPRSQFLDIEDKKCTCLDRVCMLTFCNAHGSIIQQHRIRCGLYIKFLKNMLLWGSGFEFFAIFMKN